MHLETRTITDFRILSATTKLETSFRQLMSGKSTGKKPSKTVIQRKSRGAKTPLAPGAKTTLAPGAKTPLLRQKSLGAKTTLLSIIYPYLAPAGAVLRLRLCRSASGTTLGRR